MSSETNTTSCENCGNPKLERKDYLSTVDPKWCIGCGCYSVLRNLTSVFAGAGLQKENLVAVSGIGCTSRFPYYLNTYGFHTIHGRAPTVALGLKLARPELSVWIMTGDGDALSIGGNHFMHLIRRNPNIKILLLNNRIYGLTKGQASPTTATGQKTKSTPFGALDIPLRPTALALAMGATFAARVPDTDGPMMAQVFEAAAQHKGVAFIEVMLNCVIFNDGAYTQITGKDQAPINSVKLVQGKPLIFGRNTEMGVRLNGFQTEVVQFEPGKAPPDLLVHDAHCADSSLAYALATMDHPCAIGILRQVESQVYEEKFQSPAPVTDMQKFLSGGSSWTEGANGHH
jgi:2-oxoglutarate ferredoxin oxidoreductase subunit beta